MEINFSIEDDALIKNTIIAQDSNDNTFTVKKEPIITKDVFVECFNRWIGGKDDTAAK